MVTYRLADSVPRAVAARLASERWDLQTDTRRRQRIEAWLDAGHGTCLLREAAAAKIVSDSWHCFDGVRYRLHAWVIMPNHVHVLVQMLPPHLLQVAVKGWKSFSARQINAWLIRQGRLWQHEYWDRYIRHPRHYTQAVEYIHENPVKAGLVARAEDWPWSSARERACPHALMADEDVRGPGGQTADEDVRGPARRR